MQTIFKRLLPAGFVLVLAAGMLAVLAWVGSSYTAGTAQRLVDELGHLPDNEAVDQLPQILSLGDAALPALCRALSSTRPTLADAVETMLLDELARWESLPPQEAAQKLSCLAKSLSEPTSASLAEMQRRARLAERILAWPRTGLPEMPQIIAHCESVLHAAAPAGEPQLLPDTSHARPLPWAAGDSMLARPITIATGREASRTASDQDYVEFVDEPVAIRPRETSESVPAGLSPPATLPVDMSGARPIKEADKAEPSVPVESAPQTSANPLRRTSRTVPAVSLSDLNHIPLVQLLHSDDAAIAAAARGELAKRGHSPPAIELGRRLTDADPGVRAQSAATLLQVADVDARPWLLWLSRDESTQVRLAAVTLMATSRESQMLRRVKEMSTSDTDERVRAQAQKALR